MFNSVIETMGTGFVPLLLCTAVSLLLGGVIAVVYRLGNSCTKSFALALVLLPAIVQAVIMLVNGNIGAGVAVAGAFSLVRFRSAPGTAREITAIFLAMATGLATGMGYIAYAAVFTVIIGVVFLLLTVTKFAESDTESRYLRIEIPENLDYTEVFDTVFDEFLLTRELIKVKTVDMGSIYELTYTVKLKKDKNEKEFLDKLRCRNGNLTVVLGRQLTSAAREEL